MMVQLTLAGVADGTPIYIAPHRVLAVWAADPKSSNVVMSNRLSYRVQGTPADVVAALHPAKTDPQSKSDLMLQAQQESGA